MLLELARAQAPWRNWSRTLLSDTVAEVNANQAVGAISYWEERIGYQNLDLPMLLVCPAVLSMGKPNVGAVRDRRQGCPTIRRTKAAQRTLGQNRLVELSLRIHDL